MEKCTAYEDQQFGKLIQWLKQTGQQAFTRKGQTFIVRKKPVKQGSPDSTQSNHR